MQNTMVWEMAISLGSMRVCLHPPKVSPSFPVMAGSRWSSGSGTWTNFHNILQKYIITKLIMVVT